MGWQIAEDSPEGLRISFDKSRGNGWLVLRLPVHDPKMPPNIESDHAGGCKLIYSHLKEFLSSKKFYCQIPYKKLRTYKDDTSLCQ